MITLEYVVVQEQNFCIAMSLSPVQKGRTDNKYTYKATSKGIGFTRIAYTRLTHLTER